MPKKQLIREQLDAALKRFDPLADTPPPAKGWVRTIREALGMTARQLGNRLGIAQQGVSRIEKQELSGRVTIKTMHRMAKALDCTFVYGFVPNTSLKETVLAQAKKVAAQRLDQAAQNASPGKQTLTDEEKERVIENLADALIRTLPSTFWDL